MIFNIDLTQFDTLNKKEKSVDKEEVSFSVDFDDICNVNVDDFCNEHNLDPTFIEVLDDISSTARFGKLFSPSCGGGFLRRWFNGEKFKDTNCDIDMFFIGIIYGVDFDKTRKDFKNFLINTYEGVNHSTDPNKNYDITIKINNKNQPVQLMSLPFSFYMDRNYDLNYAITKSILKFDNINSMVGYNPIKRTLVMHKKFVEYNKNKIYIYNVSQHNTSHPIRIFDRFEKFMKDGYRQPESKSYKVELLKFIASKNSKFDIDDTYQ